MIDDLPTVIDKLRKTSFRASEKLLQQFLDSQKTDGQK